MSQAEQLTVPSKAVPNGYAAEASGPSTPFAELLVTEAPETEPGEQQVTYETPFVEEYYQTDAGETIQDDPRAAEFVELLGELYDPEFDEALLEVAREVADLSQQQFSFEAPDDRLMETFLEPLRTAAEEMVEDAARAAEENDPARMLERELETFLGRFEVAETGMRPAFEEFLGGLGRKLRNVVKAGIKLAGKVLPIAVLLRKLKPLIRPLLTRVLRFGLGKLPPALRPAASALAQKLLGKVLRESADDGEYTQPAAVPVSALQSEFDLGAAACCSRRTAASRGN
jgi:hypothetical protein